MSAQLSFKQVVLIALIGFGIYFPIAGYLKYTYVPQPDPPHWVYISGPFLHVGGFSYTAFLPKEFVASADSADDPYRSQFPLYENEKPIGPPHSLHGDIAKLGGGRYSHWGSNGNTALYFSATDNSNPNENGKRYSYPKPAQRN